MLRSICIDQLNLVQDMRLEILCHLVEPGLIHIIEEERAIQPGGKVREVAKPLVFKRNLKD
jgi:hypothetical protein